MERFCLSPYFSCHKIFICRICRSYYIYLNTSQHWLCPTPTLMSTQANRKQGKEVCAGTALLSPSAPAFIPSHASGGDGDEIKKSKKMHSGPRKRRRNKKKYLDFDTSDLLERSSQGSNTSSTPGGGGGGGHGLSLSRRRERDKSYVPLYHYGLSPEESSAGLTNMNNDVDQGMTGDWMCLNGLITSSSRFRSTSIASVDVPDRSSEWLDMQQEWSMSKQVLGSIGNGNNSGNSATSGSGEREQLGVSVIQGQGGVISVSGATGSYSTSGSGSSTALGHDEEAAERKRWSDWAIRYEGCHVILQWLIG
jgi:hypothetical protein